MELVKCVRIMRRTFFMVNWIAYVEEVGSEGL